MVLFEMYGYEPDFLQKYQAAVKNLTPEQVLAACQGAWHPDEMSILVVGTPEEFDGDLSGFGTVNEIDITIPAATATLVIPAATAASLGQGQDLMASFRDKTGGAAYGKLNSSREVNELNATIQGMALTFTLETVVQRPDHMHTSQKTPFGNMTQVLAGDTAWMISPQGTQDLTGDDLTDMQHQLKSGRFAVLADLDAVQCQALAPMEMDGVACNPVNVTVGEDSQVYFLDAETGLLWMIQNQDTNPITRSPATRKVYVDAWTTMDGFQLPESMRITYDDEEFGTLTLKSFEANPEVDPALFQK